MNFFTKVFHFFSCLFLFLWLFVDYAFVWLLVFVCLFKWFLFFFLFLNVYIISLASMLIIQVCCLLRVRFVNILSTPLRCITCALCIYMFFCVMKGEKKCEFIEFVNAYKCLVLHVIELGYLKSKVIILAKHIFVSISLPHFVKFLWKLLQSNESENIITIELLNATIQLQQIEYYLNYFSLNFLWIAPLKAL